MTMDNIEQRITSFIQKTVKEAGAAGVVLGLSGGIDSSVVAALCVKALGVKKVFGLIMPDSDVTTDEDVHDATFLAQLLKINYSVMPIEGMVNAAAVQFPDVGKDKVGYGNLKARMRMVMLYMYSNQHECLVAGTGNKSELLTGYFTKYGDGAVDFLPIGDLYKTEVVELAKQLNLPENIINKVPSAGLWHGQTDEGDMGVTYAELDKVLAGGKSLKKITSLINKSAHKRAMPPVCRIKQKS
jgi:NAD+ synthase